MKIKTKGAFIIFLGVLGLWLLLLQDFDFALGKDPDYPTKPINYYIALGPGGTIDLASRSFVDAAGKHLGQPFVPINKPGAGGTLTAMAVMSAKPDGYTLGTIMTSSAFMAPFSGEAPYKDLNDFTMVANYGYFVYPFMVRGDAPWKTWKEFIEWARKNPRATKIGCPGAKSVSIQALVLWQIEKKEQVEFTYIPLKSSADILGNLLGGHINVYGSTVDTSTMPYIKEGKVRILSYLGTEKVPGYENIPSIQELYGFSISPLMGVIGPKNLPQYVLEKLDAAFAKAAKDPEYVNTMKRMYTPVMYMNRAQMKKYVDDNFQKASEIMKILKVEEAKEKK